ncbi:acyl-CoA dehydrogenase C-terminal domain-containing protein, partial [Mycobacterium tuberculosis]|nr:acyl-CoA dehydrogenase C-terminal domain-containing protein [Mycobacterium tuberculosis]
LLGRKVIQHEGASLRLLAQRIAASVAAARALGGEPAELAEALDASWQRLVTVTTAMLSAGDPAATMANSTIYLEAFGHIV